MKIPAALLESIGFNWCKVATLLLLLWLLGLERWALPVAALTCALLYVAAYVGGARESRCLLRRPLLIALFWLVVAIGWWHFHN
jgi:hypothetical protein